MGASLNPQSDMAKEMDSVLKAEVQAHSVFDPALQPAYHGVPLPGSKRNRAAVSSDPAVVPQVNFTLHRFHRLVFSVSFSLSLNLFSKSHPPQTRLRRERLHLANRSLWKSCWNASGNWEASYSWIKLVIMIVSQ